MRNSLLIKDQLDLLDYPLMLAVRLARIGFIANKRTGRRMAWSRKSPAATARDQALVGLVLVITYTRIAKMLKSSDKDVDKMIEVKNAFRIEFTCCLPHWIYKPA